MIPFILALVSLFVGFVPRAFGYQSPTNCIDGIQTAVTEFTFEGSTPDDYYGNLCVNTLSIRSTWAAAKLYCTVEEIRAGSAGLAETCKVYGSLDLVPYEEVAPILTEEFIAALLVVNFDDIDPTKTWNESVLLSSQLFQTGRDTVGTFNYEYNLHKTYGWSAYGFWGGVIVIGIIYRLIGLALCKLRKDVPDDTESITQLATNHNAKTHSTWRTYDYLRFRLIVPCYVRVLGWCTISIGLSTVTVILYWIISFVLCCVSYKVFWPNLYYTNAMQTWRYIADRTGIMSYANLPVLWAFSGRNNIFIWITGWSFSTFNVFHRHIAMIATLQALIHSIAYTVMEAAEGQLAVEWAEKYWYMGAIGTICMCLLVVSSADLVRKHRYELFLIIHIVFAVLVIVGLFYHTAIFLGEYDPYLWPLVAIWLFDRVVRILRLALCNVGPSGTGSLITTDTIATYDEDEDLIRIELSPGAKWLKPGAGQHYYLYSPLRWKGWENHPFTLAGWHDGSNATNGVNIVSVATKADKVTEAKSSSAASSSASENTSSPSSPAPETVKTSDFRQTFTFFVRPNSGWTKTLREHCILARSGTVKTHLLIEGPYGETHPLHKFERVLIIVGGSGITAGLPYLQNYLERKAGGASTRTHEITFVWATKQAAMIRNTVDKSKLRACADHEEIETVFHATSPEEEPAPAKTDLSVEQNTTDIVDEGNASGTRPRIVFGRPDVDAIVLSTAKNTSNGERLAVFTCGPTEMARAVRAAVYQAMKEGKRQVEFFEESFQW